MKKTEFEKAYDYACLLLKYRDRLTNEIKKKLESKNFSFTTINKVIKKLKENKFLNDETFIENYILSQLKKGKSLSLILSQLQEKFNISTNDIKIDIEYYKDLQYKYIKAILLKKFKEKISSQKQKVYSFLSFRGYEDSEIEKILQTLY